MTGNEFSEEFVKPLKANIKYVQDCVDIFGELIFLTDISEETRNGINLKDFDSAAFFYDKETSKGISERILKGAYQRILEGLDIEFEEYDTAEQISQKTGMTLEAAIYINETYQKLKRTGITLNDPSEPYLKKCLEDQTITLEEIAQSKEYTKNKQKQAIQKLKTEYENLKQENIDLFDKNLQTYLETNKTKEEIKKLLGIDDDAIAEKILEIYNELKNNGINLYETCNKPTGARVLVRKYGAEGFKPAEEFFEKFCSKRIKDKDKEDLKKIYKRKLEKALEKEINQYLISAKDYKELENDDTRRNDFEASLQNPIINPHNAKERYKKAKEIAEISDFFEEYGT
ncbi:hypothetical protein B6U93_00895 [Candidatus Woesearchaeota archaeon ex4484_78]|nr:MAG: hypothetical protein B6U93_00895 [Candidatus Woesearchaeota archaeon ex4484_78]